VVEDTSVLEGRPVAVEAGQAVFAPAGADHRFSAYEQLSVLVIFARRERSAA
jgi:mannose-6-phosphate isomerase-like protein (cupin superfamily)